MITDWLLAEALEAGEADPLFSRVFLAEPLEPQAGDGDSFLDNVRYFGRHGAETSEAPRFCPADGDIFVDGSCYWGSWKSLACAGAAAVQVDQQGCMIRAVGASLTRTIPPSMI